MNVRQLMAELEERSSETDVIVCGFGPIEDIVMTDDGHYILVGGSDEPE